MIRLISTSLLVCTVSTKSRCSAVRSVSISNPGAIQKQAEAAQARALGLVNKSGATERMAVLRTEMAQSMEDGCGIYRLGTTMQATCNKIDELRQRYKNLKLEDKSKVYNTEWLLAIELGYLLEVAQTMVYSAINRKESRGSHQRLDGYEERDDVNFLQHSLATYNGDDAPTISYGPVKITKSPPGKRAYGAAGVEAEAQRKAQQQQGAGHV